MRLKKPEDVRRLIKEWLAEVAETGQLPFEAKTGGVVVQMLNVWLRSYELERLADIENRLAILEKIKEQEQYR